MLDYKTLKFNVDEKTNEWNFQNQDMERLATRDSSSMAESPKQYVRSKRKRRHDDYARASSLYNYSETKTYEEKKQG